MRFTRYLMILMLLGLLLTTGPVLARSGSASASGFGSGLTGCSGLAPVPLVNPLVVSGANCTRSGIQAALDQAGPILLDCGTLTIPIDATLTLNPSKDTILDGGGGVTLDGLNQHRILFKGWHDPAKVSSVSITLQNIRLIRGKAPAGGTTGDVSGGALAAGHPGTRVYIINSTFENNTTTDVEDEDNQGGAIFVHNSYETVLSGSIFRSNTAGSGGAFGGIATGLLVYNSLFEQNRALDATSGGIVRGYGGAIHLDGVTNSYNPASNHAMRVCGSRFEANSAYRGGGAVEVVVSDNLGTLVSYDRSTFVGNEVYGINNQYGQGGAIYHVEDDRAGGVNEDNFSITNSTFDGNRAGMSGGAVWVSILGRARISNATFSANTTTAALGQLAMGGALWAGANVFDVNSSTFANNHANFMGGAIFAGGSENAVTLTNTIFANNTLNVQGAGTNYDTKWQGYHTSRTLLDGGKNIQYPRLKPDYNNDINNLITANPIFADPLLQSLADNQGPTWTMAIPANSPAVNQGSAAVCPARDQRNMLRNGVCDIGPYEYGGTVFVPTDFLFLPTIVR